METLHTRQLGLPIEAKFYLELMRLSSSENVDTQARQRAAYVGLEFFQSLTPEVQQQIQEYKLLEGGEINQRIRFRRRGSETTVYEPNPHATG